MPLIRGHKRRAARMDEDDDASDSAQESRSQRRRLSRDDEDEDVSNASTPAPASSRRPNSQHHRANNAGPSTQRRNNEDDDADIDGDGDDADQARNSTVFVTEDLAKKLVRYALACEYQRKPIRRADMNDKVMGSHGRKFREVWAQAQAQLSTVFGMQMVELPAREKVTVQQRRAAAKSSTQTKPSTQTASWVLTSILPSRFRDPVILQPPAAPTSEEESKYVAIYTVLVSLISLSGGTLPDAKMERSLRRLQLDDKVPLHDADRPEKLLKRMEKDGYLIRVKESSGAGEDDIYWTVGPRGRVEVGEDGVTGLTKAVWGDLPSEAAEDELEKKIQRSLAAGAKPVRGAEEAASAAPRRRGRPRRVDNEDGDGGGAGSEEVDYDD